MKRMVPQSGATSNHGNTSSNVPASQSHAFLAACKNECKGNLETEFPPDIDKLFEILSEWNDYLENHVPYYQKPEEPQP